MDGQIFKDQNSEVLINKVSFILTQKEFALFKVLVMIQDQVILRDTLLNKVWGFNYEGNSRALDTHIKSLKSKIGVNCECIKTVRGK
ncbi:MAG: winged helix-turn-helix transcriptional regulator [Clostridiales bacterium]|nr:winged helix-turn-helix transcriptional regulator [Clostridiales bacterium]